MILEIPTARVFKPLLNDDARYLAVHGGRGSGKSCFFADLLIEKMVANPKLRAVCIREVQSSIKESVKRLLEDTIARYNLGHLFEVFEKEIRTKQGGLIIFRGMNNYTAESIKSLQGYNIAWFEEAQSASQRSLDLLRPTIREKGSQIWFGWNPENKTDPVDVFLRGDNKPDDAVVAQANYMDNPWFPDVLKREMEYDKRRDPDKYEHIWLGGYQQNSESRVFRNWTVEDFVTPPDVERFYLGADWGYAQDPTVLVRCWIDGRKLYIDYEAYQVGCEIDKTPALFDTVPDARNWPITADSARPETIAYMQRHGYPRIKPAAKGADSVQDGIEFLKNYDIICHRRCKRTADELATYRFKTDPKTGEVLPTLEDKNNHVIDALRYAVEGIRKNSNPRIRQL